MAKAISHRVNSRRYGILVFSMLAVLAALLAWLALGPGRAGADFDEEVKLTGGQSGQAGTNFGQSVSVDGDTAVVGQDGGAVTTGRAFVFIRSSGVWTQRVCLWSAPIPPSPTGSGRPSPWTETPP